MEKVRNYTLFPLTLVEETIEILKAADVVFKTYSDIDRSTPLSSPRWRYFGEYVTAKTGNFGLLSAFLAALGLIARRKQMRRLFSIVQNSMPAHKAEVFFQHDADRNPENTLRMMQLELEASICSSCFFFRERAAESSEDIEPYELDVQQLKLLEKQGFEIGYHLNAYELAGYDLAIAKKTLSEDIRFFKTHFNLRSFVPHGGVPGKENINNLDMPLTPELEGLLWAYNGKCILKDVIWSDGMSEGPGCLDPRDVARTVSEGTRAVFLFHPQYYGDVLRPDWEDFELSQSSWWRALWGIEK